MLATSIVQTRRKPVVATSKPRAGACGATAVDASTATWLLAAANEASATTMSPRRSRLEAVTRDTGRPRCTLRCSLPAARRFFATDGPAAAGRRAFIRAGCPIRCTCPLLALGKRKWDLQRAFSFYSLPKWRHIDGVVVQPESNRAGSARSREAGERARAAAFL